MVLLNRCVEQEEESMSQIVPSAGFTPPCDYSNFADTFDLSLLPPLSPTAVPKIFSTFYPDLPLSPPLEEECKPPPTTLSSIYLEVPSNHSCHPSSPVGALYSPQLLSPNCGAYSPDVSLYAHEYYVNVKHETYDLKDPTTASSADHVLELLAPTIKEEKDLYDFMTTTASTSETTKNDHQLLREVLRDTSFQRKHNIKPFDFPDFDLDIDVKMEEAQQQEQEYDELARENIEPVLNMAIEQMRKDVTKTCTALAISPDPAQWTQSNVLSWLEFMSREFNIPRPTADQWDITGASMVCLEEEDFIKRSPQGGAILHAQLEIWKAAYLEDDLGMKWYPETSNSSGGDVTDDDDEEMASTTSADAKSTGSATPSSSPSPRTPSAPSATATATAAPSGGGGGGGSHIHLWQFLKELLASPQMHGSCIRWLDRAKGVFKIEDSVKVARLWGKRKNRPAMNYDKLSRSIRQYYKKGIMKKTERSQRLVYQFCHPYCL